MKTFVCAVCLLLAACCTLSTHAQTRYSQRMAESQGKQWTHGKSWDYVNGLVAKSLLNLCEQYQYADWTANYYQWAKEYADNAINPDGTFKNFKKGNIDNINSGKVLFALYRHEKALDEQNGTHNADRYKKAADWLRNYLVNDYSRIQTGDAKGCFFHKDIYPGQMWLDGLYMGAAFYAEWQANFDPNNTKAWTDIAHQFKTIARHTYDAGKQLYYHAWSANPEDVNSFWANKAEPHKGCSKEFWGRGMGWYFAALVDVLEVMPQSHPDYNELKTIVNTVAKGLALANYLESSASSMFTYAYLKGIRFGILPESYKDVAEKAYQGLLKTFVTTNEDGTINPNEDGTINLNQSCRSAGLGPAKDPSRDGTPDYYLCGKDVTIVNNEGKAIGPFIMACLEYELVK